MKDEKGNHADVMSICDATPLLLSAFIINGNCIGKWCRRLLRMLTPAGTNAPLTLGLVHPS